MEGMARETEGDGQLLGFNLEPVQEFRSGR